MAENEPAERSKDSSSEMKEETSILDLLLVLAKHKKFVLGLPAAAGAIALVVSLFLPNWYVASAKIMPPQQSQSNAVAILGQLGGVLAGGATQALGLKSPSDIYVAMLKSRTIADRLIARFDLRKVYDEELLHFARKELARNSAITAGREGVINIEVEDKDPKRAADIANGYADELRHLTVYLAVSEAGQRRVFFEQQLKRAKDDLTTAETELKKFNMASGLVSPQGQIGLSVAAAAALRAQIAAKEIQLSAMRSFATEANPEIKRINLELAGLRSEMAKMEQDESSTKGNALVPMGKAPEVSLEYVRKYRDVKYFETLYEVLAKQYEIARIDEAKDATLIQVLDNAVPPERKSRPIRSLVVILAVFVAALVSILWALIHERALRAARNPKNAALLNATRRELFGNHLWRSDG